MAHGVVHVWCCPGERSTRAARQALGLWQRQTGWKHWLNCRAAAGGLQAACAGGEHGYPQPAAAPGWPQRPSAHPWPRRSPWLVDAALTFTLAPALPVNLRGLQRAPLSARLAPAHGLPSTLLEGDSSVEAPYGRARARSRPCLTGPATPLPPPQGRPVQHSRRHGPHAAAVASRAVPGAVQHAGSERIHQAHARAHLGAAGRQRPRAAHAPGLVPVCHPVLPA